jgi:hypothetical protein
MKQFARFITLPFHEQVALAEAVLCLSLARLLLLIPFRLIAPLLGQLDPSSDTVIITLQPGERSSALAIRRALLRGAKRLPWYSSCLVCAFAGRMMLWRRSMPSILHLGARSDSETEMAAHAWLRCGEIDVVGTESADLYIPIVAFKA